MELKQPALLWILPLLGVLALTYVAAVTRAPRRGVVAYSLWLAADAAASARPVRRYYRDLARAIGWESRPTEVTAVAAALTLVLMLASVAVRYTVYPMH